MREFSLLFGSTGLNSVALRVSYRPSDAGLVTTRSWAGSACSLGVSNQFQPRLVRLGRPAVTCGACEGWNLNAQRCDQLGRVRARGLPVSLRTCRLLVAPGAPT